MSSGTLTVQINNVNNRFQFEEVGNTTDGAVFFDPVLRTVIVVQAGDWDLTFNANGFSFMPNPVSWEGGSQPANVTLGDDHDATTFTLLNAVIDPQDPIRFLIHSDIKQVNDDGSTSNKTVDPTILNNPQPGGGAPMQSSEELLLLIEA